MGTSRRWRRHVMVLAITSLCLLAGGQLWARAQPGGVLQLPAAGSTADEMSPRLLAGPGGQVLRLWQRRPYKRADGGSVVLEAASPPDKWQTLAEFGSSEKGVTIRDPEIAISPSNELALVYRWWRDQPRTKQVRLALSDDGGKSWSRPATPIDTSGKAFDARIAWGGGKSLVVVWADERRGVRTFDVFARRSADGGATWEPEQVLNRFPEFLPTDLFARPQLIGDGEGRLWAVWVGLRSDRSSLYLSRSVDGGRTWTDPAALTGNSQSVFGQSLHRAGQRMLLVWHDTRTGSDRVYAVASNDAGVTWTQPARVDHLPDGSSTQASSPTALLSAEGEALVAWQDTRNGRHDIFLGRSTDGGRTWGTEDRRMDMDEPGTAVSQYPRLARAADGRVALAWEDDREGLEAVYLRVRSAGDKLEWGREIRVSAPAPKLAARLPQVLWAGGLLYVTWEAWDHTLGAATVSKRVASKVLHLDTP